MIIKLSFPLTSWVAAARLAGATKGCSNRNNVICKKGTVE